MNKKGFTLLELLAVMFLIAIMATVVVPNLRPQKPEREREEFASRLNVIMNIAWNHAVATGLIHRVWLDMEKKELYIEQEDTSKSSLEGRAYKPYKSTYTRSRMSWPDLYELKNFFIGQNDELVGKNVNFKVYFVIMPDGTCQEVIINFVDKKAVVAGKRGRPASLVVNPFTAHFTLYDGFQKP